MEDSNGTQRIERQCAATANRTGQRCRKTAIRGATVCATHGGSVNRVKRKAAQRAAEDQVRVLLEKYEPYQPGPGPVDYGAALEYHIGRLAHVADFLEHQVAAISPDEWRAPDLTRVETIVRMAQTAQRMSTGALLDVAKIGAALRELDVWRDRRAAEMTEQQGQFVAAVLEMTATEAGWEWESERVYAVLAANIRRANDAMLAGLPFRPHGWRPDPPPPRPPGSNGSTVTVIGAPGSPSSLWTEEDAAEAERRFREGNGRAGWSAD